MMRLIAFLAMLVLAGTLAFAAALWWLLAPRSEDT